MSFQKMYGLYGLKHHTVERGGDVTDEGRTNDQALTGTRYRTLPGLLFYYPYPTRKFFRNFRVQGSYYTCCF